MHPHISASTPAHSCVTQIDTARPGSPRPRSSPPTFPLTSWVLIRQVNQVTSLSPSVKINEEKSITVRSEREQPWWKIAFSRPISPRFRFNRHYTSRKAFPGGSEVKASACSAGDPSLIPGSGRSPGEGSGNPLQHSCLENPMDRGA